MNYNKHYNIKEGDHALLSASSSAWVNYDLERLMEVAASQDMKRRGTILHDFASRAIKFKLKQIEDGSTLSLYVNDCIDEGMDSEQVLYYSEHCFGTADAISFKDGVLRIYDLKTGVLPAKMRQLEIYAALFCLEYECNPTDINIVLRIYQNDAMVEVEGDAEQILEYMDTIVRFSAFLDEHLDKNLK